MISFITIDDSMPVSRGVTVCHPRPDGSLGGWKTDRYTMKREFGYRIYLVDMGIIEERSKKRDGDI